MFHASPAWHSFRRVVPVLPLIPLFRSHSYTESAHLALVRHSRPRHHYPPPLPSSLSTSPTHAFTIILLWSTPLPWPTSLASAKWDLGLEEHIMATCKYRVHHIVACTDLSPAVRPCQKIADQLDLASPPVHRHLIASPRRPPHSTRTPLPGHSLPPACGWSTMYMYMSIDKRPPRQSTVYAYTLIR
jgi:hypothetical protein